MRIYFTLCALAAIFVAVQAQSCFRNLVPDLSFKLTGQDVAFPCESTKNIYKNTGRYVSKNILVTRLQIYKDQAIVAVPRCKHGVPFTLATFSLKSKGCKATLAPYPCWEIQEEGNCDALQNVVDISIDCMDTLWVLDSGLVNTLEQPVRRCVRKIVGIDLKTGFVVKVIYLDSYMTANSRLQYLVADYSSGGRPYAYVADGGAGAILVFDLSHGVGHRVVLPKVVTGDSDSITKDVLYMLLVRKPSGNKLYFTYLSSTRLYYIKTSYLQTGQAIGAIVDVGAKPQYHKIVLLGTDNGAGILFRGKGESDIYIWDSDTSFKKENFILVHKGDDYKLPTEVVAGYKKLMWAIESNFHDYVLNTCGCLGPSMAVHPLIKTYD